MKWIYAILAAIVLAMPLGFAEQVEASARAEAKVSAMDLHFKQIGQAFGDFAFNVKSFLTFDESAKIEMLKERNAEMRERQEAWLEAKAGAFEDASLSIEEKEDIRAMIQAEHEAIIKEHLRLTSEIREIQLKAKARGLAQLESEAEAAAESGSGLSLGLVSVDVKGDVNGARNRALFIEKTENAKVHVSGNVVLDADTRAAIERLVSNISADQNIKVGIEIEKEAGANATVEHEVNGLAENQQALLANLESKAEALVEASASADARLEIEIRHRAKAETIDTAAEAQAAVEKRLHVDASNVAAETQNGVQVFVVTGTETRTSGSFEMTKSFEVVIESGTGIILSADMTAHFEKIAEASASGSAAASVQSTASTSGSAQSNAQASASGSAGTGGSVDGASASTQSSAVAVGGLTIG